MSGDETLVTRIGGGTGLLTWVRVSLDLHGSRTPQPIEVRPPSRFRRAWYRVIALLALRRSDVGGFGGSIPEQTSGGG